ncbi:MAG: aspartyl/glutamyl-tRNA amidotransferase subunit A [Gammaproteobacteria bacterium RIFCSPHIGHO2_02_FULL_42_13]|nr:MAG: aspartyl/glutamyl-tRNA amidotransferase subunit A [Gammaproteobacteria bacterium RIFCSPHIGHO2_02_FULL_42_13]
MHTKTLLELSDALKHKKISSIELTQHFLDRIKKFDPMLNAFITITERTALREARKADERISKNQASVLTGIPIAHKDVFCTADIKTSCGSKMLDNFVSPYDATCVQKLKNTGMVLLGKTNMDEFAMGSSNENSYYGPVKNPWDLDKVPGGSSGGSCAAVAARMVPIATGTDTGGSIRQPAALSGVTGLKPTYGRVSRFGMIAFASSLDQAGVIAKTAEDVAVLLNDFAGFDPNDSTSADNPVPDFTAHLNKSISGLHIGLPKECFNEQLDAKMADKIYAAAKEFEKQGAILHDIDLPMMRAGMPAYYVVAPAEAASNLARYDGVRFGHRCDNPKDLEDLYARSRSEGFGDEVKHRIFTGTYVLSSTHYNAYYKKAQQIRTLIRRDYENAFKNIGIILTPTSPTTAFSIGSRMKDRIQMYLSDVFTVSISLAGLPGISIPAGFLNNLPVGVQLIGNYFEESTLLNVAHRYQQVTDWHLKIPEKFRGE